MRLSKVVAHACEGSPVPVARDRERSRVFRESPVYVLKNEYGGNTAPCFSAGSKKNLLAVDVVCPFLDNSLGGLSAAPVVMLGGCRPVLLGLLVIDIGLFPRGFRWFCLSRSLGLVTAGMIPAPARVPAPVPPVVPPLSLGILPLSGLAYGGLGLFFLFFHNCQTDQSGQEPQIVWHGRCRKPGKNLRKPGLRAPVMNTYIHQRPIL